MQEVLVAETCPVCNSRRYVKQGEKLECCPEPKKTGKKGKPESTVEETPPSE